MATITPAGVIQSRPTLSQFKGNRTALTKAQKEFTATGSFTPIQSTAFDPKVPQVSTVAKAPITKIPTSTVGLSASERQQVDELRAKQKDSTLRGQGTVAQRLDPLLGGEFAKEKFLTEEAKRLNLDIGNLPLDEKSAVTDLEKRLEESQRNKTEQIALQRKINSVQGENLLQTSRGARGGLQAQLAQGQGLQSTARAGALKSTSAFIEKQRQTSIDRLEFADRSLREIDRQLEDARKRGATDLITSLAKRRSGVEAAKQEAELNAAKLEQEIATQANKTTQGLLESLGGGDLTQGLTSVANLELPQLQNLISSFGGDPSQAFQILGASQALAAAKTPEAVQGILGAFQQVANIGLGAAGEKAALLSTLQTQLDSGNITQKQFDQLAIPLGIAGADGVDLKTIKVGEDVYSFNPQTNETRKIVDSSKRDDILPTGVLETATFAGRKLELDSGALAAFALANSSAVDSGLGELKIGAVETSSFRTDSAQAVLYGKGRSVEALLSAGFTPEDAKNLASPGEAVVTWTTQSRHKSGMAVDIFPDQDYIAQVKPFLEAEGWVQTLPTKDAGHFEFKGKVGTGILSEAQQGTLKIQIGKAAFGTRISDAEGVKVDAIIDATIKENPKLSIPEIRNKVIDDLIGFTLTDNKEFGNNLKENLIVNAPDDGLSGIDARGVARLVNSGKLAAAMTKVENIAMRNVKELDPDGFIGEATVSTAVERANELIDTIDGLDSNPVGVVSGTMQGWFGRLKGKNAQDISTQIVSQVAAMRNRLSGTAVTESEERFLEPLIPKLSDSPANFMVKLNQLKKNPLVELNNLRDVVSLPVLDENTLLNKDQRVGLYQGEVVDFESLFQEAQGETPQTFNSFFETF